MTNFNEAKISFVEAVNNTADAIHDKATRFTEGIKANAGKLALIGLAVVGAAVGTGVTPANAAPERREPAAGATQEDNTTANNTAENNQDQDQADQNDPVEKAVQANIAKFREAGGGRAASEDVARQEVSVFLGADRGEIVGERADGACIIATQDGKRVEEFTKTELKVGMTPEEAKEVYVNGLCNGENGVNVPAVATYMAHLEAMKNNIDIQKDFEKVNTELTVKYIDAMKNNPDLAQVYLETAQDFLRQATFGDVTSIEGQRDVSIYTNEDGHIVTVDVLNKAGAVEVPITFTTENINGVMVTQTANGKRCTQVFQKYAPAPEAPKKAKPTPHARQPKPTTDTPPRTTVRVFKVEKEVCVDLVNGQRVFQTVVGEATSQAEAERIAQAEFDRLQAEHEGDCDVIGTTTTTTTQPTTTTTLLVTTTSTDTTLPPTTVTVTVPDKITTTTIDAPEDPTPTTQEDTIPDTTRPDATVRDESQTPTTIIETARDAAGDVVEGTVNVGGAVGSNPLQAAGVLMTGGGLTEFVRKRRKKLYERAGKVATKG